MSDATRRFARTERVLNAVRVERGWEESDARLIRRVMDDVLHIAHRLTHDHGSPQLLSLNVEEGTGVFLAWSCGRALGLRPVQGQSDEKGVYARSVQAAYVFEARYNEEPE